MDVLVTHDHAPEEDLLDLVLMELDDSNSNPHSPSENETGEAREPIIDFALSPTIGNNEHSGQENQSSLHIKPSLNDSESHSIDPLFDAMFEHGKEEDNKSMHPVIESTQRATMIENSSTDNDNDDDNLVSIVNLMDEEKMPKQTREIPIAQASTQLHMSRVHLVYFVHHIHKVQQNKHRYHHHY